MTLTPRERFWAWAGSFLLVLFALLHLSAVKSFRSQVGGQAEEMERLIGKINREQAESARQKEILAAQDSLIRDFSRDKADLQEDLRGARRNLEELKARAREMETRLYAEQEKGAAAADRAKAKEDEIVTLGRLLGEGDATRGYLEQTLADAQKKHKEVRQEADRARKILEALERQNIPVIDIAGDALLDVPRPPLMGKVVLTKTEGEGALALVDLGYDDSVRIGETLVASRDGKYLGVIGIERVPYPHLAWARIYKKFLKEPIQKGDWVRTDPEGNVKAEYDKILAGAAARESGPAKEIEQRPLVASKDEAEARKLLDAFVKTRKDRLDRLNGYINGTVDPVAALRAAPSDGAGATTPLPEPTPEDLLEAAEKDPASGAGSAPALAPVPTPAPKTAMRAARVLSSDAASKTFIAKIDGPAPTLQTRFIVRSKDTPLGAAKATQIKDSLVVFESLPYFKWDLLPGDAEIFLEPE